MSHEAYARLARHLGADEPDAALDALRAVADDPALVETIRRHHLITLLWRTVREDDLRARIPAGAFAELVEWLSRRRPSATDNLRVLAEAQDVLARAGIGCLVLKGAYFADRLYGGLERRPQYDVDLLVRRGDFASATRTLGAIGYVERWRDLHSITLLRDDAHVDLHWCFRNAPAYRLDEARIWRDAAPYTVAGTTFTTPSDEDMLVALSLAVFQDVGLGTAKLKQLVDVDLLVRDVDARLDWAAFLRRREREGTLAIVVNVLDLVAAIFRAAPAVPRLAAALAEHRDLLVARGPDDAARLVFAARGTTANRLWFFRVYPGSIARYWLWLLPRKLPTYLAGRAPARGASSMTPSLETVQLLLRARRRSS